MTIATPLIICKLIRRSSRNPSRKMFIRFILLNILGNIVQNGILQWFQRILWLDLSIGIDGVHEWYTNGISFFTIIAIPVAIVIVFVVIIVSMFIIVSMTIATPTVTTPTVTSTIHNFSLMKTNFLKVNNRRRSRHRRLLLHRRQCRWRTNTHIKTLFTMRTLSTLARTRTIRLTLLITIESVLAATKPSMSISTMTQSRIEAFGTTRTLGKLPRLCTHGTNLPTVQSRMLTAMKRHSAYSFVMIPLSTESAEAGIVAVATPAAFAVGAGFGAVRGDGIAFQSGAVSVAYAYWSFAGKLGTELFIVAGTSGATFGFAAGFGAIAKLVVIDTAF
mmetsp:Transcript_26127/g.56101  ORF Transcript_26127/g.56101 Transcript_26127/m.56101 type:complete len:333 (+) Transcript_26127:1238-2236(+)